MDDIEDFSDHADKVLSGLRNAVGSADDKILLLQKELELLEKKAQENDEFDLLVRRVSGTSELSDEDDLQDLHDLGNTSDDNVLSSLRSSTPTGAGASTKMYHTHSNIEFYHGSKAKHAYVHEELTSDDAQDDTSMIKINSDSEVSSHGNEKKVDERWGCLKRVLSEDLSGSDCGPAARDELFKQILKATEKKLPKTATKNKSSKIKTQPSPKPRVAYNGLFSSRQDHSGTSTSASRDRKKKTKLYSDESKRSRHNSHFRPISSELMSSKSDGDDSHDHFHALQEVKLENERLQKLLAEEKKHSDKLCDKICDLEKDVEELQVRIELKGHEQTSGKISDLIEDIQKAQKLRENAMLERIEIASRDRDDAIMRAKAMFLKNTLSQDDKIPAKEKQDQTMMDLVDRIAGADSAVVIERYGNELVERMNNLKNARSRITEEEMAVVIRERDEAVAKCHNLEQELRKHMESAVELKQSRTVSINDHLKEKVLSTEEDCKKAHARLHDAEEEIENLKSSYRVFKSRTHAQDEDLAKRYNECLKKIQDEANLHAEVAKKFERQNHLLLSKLKKSKSENQKICLDNEKLKQEYHATKEKCGKLERLVRVLRKKLITQAQHHGQSH